MKLLLHESPLKYDWKNPIHRANFEEQLNRNHKEPFLLEHFVLKLLDLYLFTQLQVHLIKN